MLLKKNLKTALNMCPLDRARYMQLHLGERHMGDR